MKLQNSGSILQSKHLEIIWKLYNNLNQIMCSHYSFYVW